LTEVLIHREGVETPERIERDDTIRTEPDRSLSEREFRLDVALAQHAEMDCMGGGEYRCGQCEPNMDAREAIREEVERRKAEGIFVEDPDEPTLEERLGPYGLEWQIEQRERAEGGWL
jgi:hypothetical protein